MESSRGVSYYTAQEGGEGRSADHGAYGASGSVPYFSTVPYKAPKVRDSRLCVGNDNTCKGWQTKDSELCSGHMKSKEKADAIEDEG